MKRALGMMALMLAIALAVLIVSAIARNDPDSAMSLMPLLGWALIIVVAIVVIRVAVKGALRQRDGDVRRDRPRREYRAPAQAERFIDGAIDMGPGRFVVYGVDRSSRMDTTWHVNAESEANARAKANLEGIEVTAVEREI